MFGLGKNKTIEQPASSSEAEQPKIAPYNVNDEAVFFVMPTRFKKQDIDAKKAQKTGIIIMVAASIFILMLLAALAWYLFIYPDNLPKQDAVAVQQNIEVATSSDLAPTMENLGASATTSAIDIATSSEAAATTSISTTSSEVAMIEALNQAPVVIASSTDSDDDGLTDAEEAVFTTNKNKADSDSDGYSDLAEVRKGYNPAGAGKLTSSKVMGSFVNDNFSMMYPAIWQFTSSGNDSVVFNVGNEQMIKISVQPNLKSETIVFWYKEQFGNQEINDSQFISQVDQQGNSLWQGIFSPDGLTVYLTNDRKQAIVSINYDLGFSNELGFKELFLAMINSFILKN